MCRRQIVNMSPILARFLRIDSSRYRFRYAERNVIPATVPAGSMAEFQDTRFIDEETADGAFMKQPEFRQLFRREVALKHCLVTGWRTFKRVRLPSMNSAASPQATEGTSGRSGENG